MNRSELDEIYLPVHSKLFQSNDEPAEQSKEQARLRDRADVDARRPTTP